MTAMFACNPDCERIDYESTEPTFTLVRADFDGESLEARAEDVEVMAGLAQGLEHGWVRLTIDNGDAHLTLTCMFRRGGRSSITGAIEDVCRCSDLDSAVDAEPCLELQRFGPKPSTTYADLADVSGTMSLEIRELSPEHVEIDVAIDGSVLATNARVLRDAGASVPVTASIVMQGLSTKVTRRVVEGDCNSSSPGCGCKYGGWLPGK